MSIVVSEVSVMAGLSPEGYARARRLLMRRDPILGAAIKRIGPCGMADRQRSDLCRRDVRVRHPALECLLARERQRRAAQQPEARSGAH